MESPDLTNSHASNVSLKEKEYYDGLFVGKVKKRRQSSSRRARSPSVNSTASTAPTVSRRRLTSTTLRKMTDMKNKQSVEHRTPNTV